MTLDWDQLAAFLGDCLLAVDAMTLIRFRSIRSLLVLSLLSLTGCSMQSFNAFYTAGPVAGSERDLILITTVLMLFVFIPVVVATLFFAWRYRESNTKAAYAPNWSHSALLEVFLWGGPIVIIAILGTLTWYSTHSLDPYKALVAKGQDPVEVDAISLDWKWLFVYPQYNVASVNELAMPANTPVHMNLTSDTVMTAIMIPRLGSQIFVMSGMRTQLNLMADHKGQFFGKNYQYTGKGFASEHFKTVSMSQSDFKAWVQRAKTSGQRLDWARYNQLAHPSVAKGVTYFSPVKPHLLNYVIRQYHNSTPRNYLTQSAAR